MPSSHANPRHHRRRSQRGGCRDVLPPRVGRRAGGLRQLGEAEVEDLDRTIRPQLDIRGLEIAVDNPLLMRGFQCQGDLLGYRHGLVDRDRSTFDPLQKILALHEFHHQGGHAPALFEPVDARDVRVIQRREGLGFTLEAREPIGVVRERLGQDLDRDVAIQLRVTGPEDLAHSPFANAGDNFVDTETGTGGKDQR